ncbi:uncharacterized protein LOC132951719 [Metopolophium dirhodum]|uniref:uncharacterized protein LOC132951719 n=1 Tax=Metopolophium dirhodum TaxID=44670 RepID=UPI0029903F39|nr:uncharacterized protein LOC132951719 [Metopolophium dirhodum]
MMKLSKKKFAQLEIDTTVRVTVADVDRACGSPRNILAVVTQLEHDLYKLCTEHGFLKYNYTRQEIAACEENLLEMDNVIKLADGRQLTLREAASNSSVAGPQGYQRCHCKTGCNNKRCACRRAEILCNSKCHGSTACKNKYKIILHFFYF